MKIYFITICLIIFFALNCEKKTQNIESDKDTDRICDTLLVDYEGFIKTFTKDGLIDSSGLTENNKKYLRDSIDFKLDTLVFCSDSFLITAYSNGEVIGCIHGIYDVLPDSIRLNFKTLVIDTMILAIDSSMQSFFPIFMGFEGDTDTLKNRYGKTCVIIADSSSNIMTCQTIIGNYDNNYISKMTSGFDADDTLIYWDYYQVFK